MAASSPLLPANASGATKGDASFLTQTLALARKNMLVLSRSKLTLVTLALAPVAFVGVLFIVAASLHSQADSVNPTPFGGLPFEPCEAVDVYGRRDPHGECITIGWSGAAGAPVMKRLQAKLGLDASTVVDLGSDPLKTLSERVGVVETLVTFQSASSYTIVYNVSRDNDKNWGYEYSNYQGVAKMPTTRIIVLQAAIDAAIVGDNWTFDPHFQFFDTTGVNAEDDTQGVAALGDMDLESIGDKVARVGGAVALVTGVTVSAAFVLNLVSKEKQRELLGLLRLIGVRESAYWISWWFCLTIVALFSALASVALGYSAGFHVFTRASFFAHWVALFLFLTAMLSLGMALSACVRKPKWVNLMSALLFFGAVALSSLITAFFSAIYDPSVSLALRIFFEVQPNFHYQRIFYDISNGTRSIEVPNPAGQGDANLIENLHYSFADLYKTHTMKDCDYDNCCHLGGSCFEVPSANYSLMMMMALTVLYILLAWYCAQVCGGSSGHQPAYFLCLPRYWGLAKPAETFVRGDTIAREQVKSQHDKSIRIHKLTKTYGSSDAGGGTTAVKELSLELRRSQVTAILGPNGSGKSTTCSVLSGLTSPTFGEAFVFGLDVRTETAAIQRRIGSCPQDNILFDELSCREHVELFASVRGAPPGEVERTLHEFQLTEFENRPAQALSGGMKRKLQIALAFVSAPDFILLDEPTTGMDALIRRAVWATIRRNRADKVILLTTHDMVEADFLGDSIALLNGGRLRAHGTSLFLKNKFGTGFQLNLLSRPSSIHQLETVVKKMFPSADVLDASAGTLSIAMPRASLRALPSFFNWIESQAGAADGAVEIREWSIAQSSLEEVFLRLCQQADVNAVDFVQQQQQEQAMRICQVCNERPTDPVTLFTASGIKVRADSLVCARCARPGGPDGAAGEDDDDKEDEEAEEKLTFDAIDDDAVRVDVLGTQASSKEKGSDHDDGGDDGDDDYDGDVQQQQQRFRNRNVTSVPSAAQQLRAIALKNVSMSVKQRKTLCIKLVLLAAGMLALVFTGVAPSRCPQGWSAKWGCSPEKVQKHFRESLDTSVSLTSSNDGKELWTNPMANTRLKRWTAGPGWTDGKLNVTQSDDVSIQFLSHGASADLEKEVSRSVLWVKGNVSQPPSFCGGWTDPGYWVMGSQSDASAIYYGMFPDDAITITELDQRRFSYRFQFFSNDYDTQVEIWYADAQQQSCSWTGSAAWAPHSSAPFVVSGMDNALARRVLGVDDSMPAPIQTSYSALPDVPWESPVTISAIMSGMTFIGFLASLLLPDVVSRLLIERETGLFATMRVSGLRGEIYFAANIIYDESVISLWSIFFVLLAFLFGSPIIRNAGMGVWLLLLLLWSHAQVGFAIFMVGFFKKRGLAVLLSYLFCILLAVVGPIFHQFLHTDVPTGAMLVPPIAFLHALDMVCTFGGTTIEPSSELATALAMLFFSGTLFLVLGIYVNTLYYLSPLWPVTFVRDRLCRRRPQDGSPGEYSVLVHPVPAGDDLEKSAADDEDEDVRAARLELIDRVKRNDLPAVLVYNLKKVYEASSTEGVPKVAVDGVFLGVDFGTTLALLGPNGAGKSTTQNAIAGLLSVTSGSTFVAGYNVQKELESVYNTLGVCPQHDCVWPDLTVREHLLFYCRLKGIPRASENAVVQQLAESVSLDGDALYQSSSALSGGTRRRLSIAMSLVGDPSVWLIDEPSTGLSPEARRVVWRIVNEQKKRGRAIIITTHALEEADTLAQEIAIMQRGKLRCIGTQQTLKRRFGEGFKITFHMSHDFGVVRSGAVEHNKKIDTVVAFVQKHVSPRASFASCFGTVVTFELPEEARNEVLDVLANLDRFADRMKRSFGVQEWGLSQSTLEEVFIKLVKDDEDEKEEEEEDQDEEKQ